MGAGIQEHLEALPPVPPPPSFRSGNLHIGSLKIYKQEKLLSSCEDGDSGAGVPVGRLSHLLPGPSAQ